MLLSQFALAKALSKVTPHPRVAYLTFGLLVHRSETAGQLRSFRGTPFGGNIPPVFGVDNLVT
jgi:hypothetical protein